jgi:Asp-tRNA(Asn)/Glu-tRNA(Gln) amidotransferase A subunit family amidase
MSSPLLISKLQMYLLTFSPTGNLAGICGISIPAASPKLTGAQPRNNRGSRTSSELPIGLQLLGQTLDEA